MPTARARYHGFTILLLQMTNLIVFSEMRALHTNIFASLASLVLCEPRRFDGADFFDTNYSCAAGEYAAAESRLMTPFILIAAHSPLSYGAFMTCHFTNEYYIEVPFCFVPQKEQRLMMIFG